MRGKTISRKASNRRRRNLIETVNYILWVKYEIMRHKDKGGTYVYHRW